MCQENLQTMIMQNFWGVKEVYYGIVQVVNLQLHGVTGADSKIHCTLSADQKRDSDFNV